MELAIKDSGKSLSVSDTVFNRDFSQDLVHQVVVAFRNAGRRRSYRDTNTDPSQNDSRAVHTSDSFSLVVSPCSCPCFDRPCPCCHWVLVFWF